MKKLLQHSLIFFALVVFLFGVPGIHVAHASAGESVDDHVLQARRREKRIEQIMAIISTILVVGVSLLVGGCSIAEGVMVYAVAGAVMYGLAKKTFY